MTDRCPFCKHDPYEYVHNGLGLERVAVTCCELGYDLLSPGGDYKAAHKILSLMQSYSPRKKARARRLLEQHQ